VKRTLIWSCYSQIGFLHRAADLTLVPSAAISKDFETAQVISGWSLSVQVMFGVHMPVFPDSFSSYVVNNVLSLLIQLTEYAFGTKVLILQASIPDFAVTRCGLG